MENSRRGFDRSRDPGPMKKARLNEAAGRFRVTEKDQAYQPQPVHPHYELVNQYKSALAELTFNSKPIITNLTIIAGENVHAAKAVVSTICNNILEVPSDQKLPTLYLLDSIVKNIGRDYIKYFGARLPEIFVKAYRQVDPPMHSNMRHLFGTWKGVFHPQTLQQIEKELGFNARTDGSAAVVTTTRADPQSQRPPHSIHVNPKYLERQRLQQSGRTKSMITDEIAPDLTRDSDRLDRVSNIASGASWVGPAKVNAIRRPQRDSLTEPLFEKDITSTAGEYDYASDLPHNSRSVIKKIGSRVNDDGGEKQWYEAMSISDPRDALPTKSRISNNYAPARLENSESSGPSRNIGVHYDNWKNSEEEEFMWDMHSRLSETDVATINPSNELRAGDARFPQANATDLYSSEQKDPSVYGRWTSSPKSLHDSEVFSSTNATLAAGRKGIQPQARVVTSKILSNAGSGSDRQSPLHDSTSKQNVTKQDFRRAHSLPQRDPRASRFPAKSQSSQFKTTNTLVPPDASEVENFEYKPTTDAPGLTIASESTGQPNMSDLLQAVMKSGILSSNKTSGVIKEENSQEEVKSRGQTLSSASKLKTLPVSLASVNLLASVASPQTSKNNSKASDPLSSLLSSLVSKGLISASKTTTEEHSPDHSTSSSVSASVVPSDAQALGLGKQGTSTSPTVKVLAAPLGTTKLEPENLIGLKFRADKIRELHPSVISSLFDDLPHLCTSCGIRLKEKEELDRHMELHDKKKPELSGTNSTCRDWFPKADDWIAGKSAELEPEPEEVLSEPENDIEDGPTVAADENQCACILCGKIFEDYFSQERDKWMFKGASYMTIPPANSEANGPIVHAGCLATSSLQSLGVGNAIKQEIIE